MIKLKTIIFIQVLLTVMSSCTDDIFFELPKCPDIPAVNMLFTPDSTWKLSLYHLSSLDTIDGGEPIDNASIQITSPDDTYHLHHLEDGIYISHEKPGENINYELHVSLPNYPTIMANDHVPISTFPQVKGIEKEASVLISDDIYEQIEAKKISIYFDSSMVENNYLLSAYAIRKAKYLESDSVNSYEEVEPFKQIIKLHSNDQHFTNIAQDLRHVIGPVSNITKDDYMLDLWIPLDEYRTGAHSGSEFYISDFYLEIYHGSSNFFEYVKTSITQISYRINPFTEPVKVYSNIENGTGIFAGYHKKVFQVREYK
jgi:hypothetical protein